MPTPHTPPPPSAPAPFPLERDDAGIVTLRLDQSPSPMVVLDHALIRRIEATLNALRAGPHPTPTPPTGFILASASPRVFIAGADLKTIQSPLTPGSRGLGDDQLDRYLAYGQRVFGMIADLPCPTVAAINGAALGGGLEIAMHCDALVAAASPGGKPGGYPIGLPEAGLSICPGWGGTNLLPARMDPKEAILRTAAGRPMNFDEAKAAGLFDAVAESPETLIDAAKRWIAEHRHDARRRDGAPSRWIGRDPAIRLRVERALDALAAPPAPSAPPLPRTEPAAACLSAVRAGLAGGWPAALEVERRELVRLRHTEAGRAAIAGFFEKSSKPR